MKALLIALAVYAILAAILYARYESRSYIGSFRGPPPRRYIRFAVPWYYSTPPTARGNWLFGYWNSAPKKHPLPERGIRILGFEFWIEYWH